MACAPCQQRAKQLELQQKQQRQNVIPNVSEKPNYLDDFESLLNCIKENKIYLFTNHNEVNFLLDMIGVMKSQGNYGIRDLSSQYNRIKNTECTSTI